MFRVRNLGNWIECVLAANEMRSRRSSPGQVTGKKKRDLEAAYWSYWSRLAEFDDESDTFYGPICRYRLTPFRLFWFPNGESLSTPPLGGAAGSEEADELRRSDSGPIFPFD